MPTDHNSSSRAGRPDSPWRIHKTYYLLVFAAVAAGIYQWGKVSHPGGHSAGSVESTAKIYYQPVDDSPTPQPADPKHFERELASTENLQRAVRRLSCQVRALPDETPEATVSRTIERIRRGLQVTAFETAVPGRVEIALSFRGRPADDPARLVNGLAEDFAERVRHDWKERTRRAYEDARGAARAAKLELTRAKARLDGFFDRHFEQLGSATEPQPKVLSDDPAGAEDIPAVESPGADTAVLPRPDPRPMTVDNPDWIALAGQLDELKQRRAEMLIERTKFHPKVLQADIEIAAAERRLQTVARQIPGSPPALPEAVVPELQGESLVEQPAAELARMFRNLKADADTAVDAYRRASEAESAAWQRHQQQPQIELVLAEATVAPASSKPPTGLLSLALVAGLAAVAGVGLFCGGVAMEPTLNTIDQIEAALAVPVIGTVAAMAPTGDSGAFGPLPSIARPVLIVVGLLLIAGCAVAAAWAVR